MIKDKKNYFRRIIEIIILFGIFNIAYGNIISNEIGSVDLKPLNTLSSLGNNLNNNLGILGNFPVNSNSMINPIGSSNINKILSNANNINSLWSNILKNNPNFPNTLPINFPNFFPFNQFNQNNQQVPTKGLFANNKIPLFSTDI